jgi:catabolite regulation protein CreA
LLQYKETLTEYIAEKTLTLNDTTLFLSFLSMIWRDQYITVVYDNLNKAVADVWFDPVFQDGDLEIIQNLIDNFLDNY